MWEEAPRLGYLVPSLPPSSLSHLHLRSDTCTWCRSSKPASRKAFHRTLRTPLSLAMKFLPLQTNWAKIICRLSQGETLALELWYHTKKKWSLPKKKEKKKKPALKFEDLYLPCKHSGNTFLTSIPFVTVANECWNGNYRKWASVWEKSSQWFTPPPRRPAVTLQEVRAQQRSGR